MDERGYERWRYVGPAYKFSTVVANKWQGETLAPTKAKALSNLTYQFKKSVGYTAGSGFKLDPKYLHMA